MSWLRANWKNLLLVLSLAVNLFVIGMVGAHMFGDRRDGGRIQAAGWSQLLPRGFFMQLEESRRQQLLGELKSQGNIFKQGRGAVRRNAATIADALAAEPFDAAKLQEAVGAFGAEGKRLMDEGARVAMDVMGKLSPEERRLLADAIRKRAGK